MSSSFCREKGRSREGCGGERMARKKEFIPSPGLHAARKGFIIKVQPHTREADSRQRS